jgi:hypothetical protein
VKEAFGVPVIAAVVGAVAETAGVVAVALA